MFDLETLLIKTTRLLSYFSNPISEFCLTYQSELIDEDQAEENLPTAAVLYKHKPYYTALLSAWALNIPPQFTKYYTTTALLQLANKGGRSVARSDKVRTIGSQWCRRAADWRRRMARVYPT